MERLRVRNLRSLVDSGDVNFKRINIFVGQNSSGKSTFLRCLPLLKQSAQVKTKSDILWFGPYVDFGSFEESFSRNSSGPEEIEFTIDMFASFRRLRYRPRSGFRFRRALPVTLSLKLIRDSSKEKPFYLTKYRFSLYDRDVELVLSENLKANNFYVDDVNLTAEANQEFSFFRTYSLLPGVNISSEFTDDGSVFDALLTETIRPYVHGLKSTDDIRRTVAELQLGKADSVLEQLKLMPLGEFWRARIQDWDENSPEVLKICRLLMASSFHHVIEAISDSISETVQRVQYITPLRATAERYYREQGLAVDEIDPSGQNLAMFLQNLSGEELIEFANWTADNMGFEVRPQVSQGHVSLVLSDPGSSDRVNLADTGFGYSQVLPILAQLWYVRKTRKPWLTAPVYCAIEQPELHLHPKMQANLTDIFVKISEAAKKEKIDYRIVLETHSETIINQLGKAVEKGKIARDDIAIYIFEKIGLSGETRVVQSGFDEDGFLVNWPYGFFDSEE